ncbi:MAG TPA: hypothetical protein VD995_13405 [Azospirillum sp.]|nr:hypothetical protein [Azospirillum sp.]
MLTIHDRIRELRAELDRLVALQAAMDTVADAALCSGVAPPG